MRLFLFIFLSVFFTSILSAEYLRSIRIGSFLNEKDAQEALVKLQEFAAEHENIVALQKENEFIFKARKSGSYHITLAEPFTNRIVLQEVLDTLRLEFEGVYVTKLKSKDNEVKQVEKTFKTPKKEHYIQETPVIIEEPKVEELVQESEELIDEVLIEDIIEKNLQTKEQEVSQKAVEDTKKLQNPVVEVENENNSLWQFMLIIILFILLVVIKLFLSSRKKNDVLVDDKTILEGKIAQLEDELKNKDKLVSYVSHELRTPMTAIMGLSHLVLESDLSKLQRENIHRIEHSAQHLLSLINDILDVSKMQAGELKLEKSEFNINDIIEYVLNIISVQAKDNNIDLAVDISHKVPSRIIGDSLRLGQVLINILGNAVKFTKDGEIVLKIDNLSSFDKSIVLEFSISDTGIGMTDEQISKIFNSYAQAENSISREFGGTGLGLSITKQLVEMMNGSIKVESKKGVGTTFTFSVQLQLKDAENKRHYRLPSSSFLNKRVLVIDPSTQNQILLQKSLGYFNYHVNIIPSCEEAILDEKMKFNIIIIHESVLTSLAVEKINEIQKLHNSKIVVLNDFYHVQTFTMPKKIKIDAYLRTPFTQQSMLDMIIELYVVKQKIAKAKKQTFKTQLSQMSGKKILVAEDNELNHKVISGLLSKSGIELTFVKDGQSAVDLIQQNIDFDMVLMDINMPIMNGISATKEIRKHSQFNNLPIVALSADVMENAKKEVLEAGMQGHIAKPIIVDTFYKKIYDTLNASEVLISNTDEINSNMLESGEEFDELSITTGLNRCNKDVEFYKSILKDFKIMYADSPDKFLDLCERSRFSEARRMAMDIKDVTLNLGAYNLCENVATMEYEFEKGSRSNYEKMIKFYHINLEKLFIDIDKYLEKK